jgi:hypothetical protein
MTRSDEICALQAIIWSLRCEELAIPGGATPSMPLPPAILVDPHAVVIDDLLRARPGSIIRTKRGHIEFPHGIGWLSPSVLAALQWSEIKPFTPEVVPCDAANS